MIFLVPERRWRSHNTACDTNQQNHNYGQKLKYQDGKSHILKVKLAIYSLCCWSLKLVFQENYKVPAYFILEENFTRPSSSSNQHTTASDVRQYLASFSTKINYGGQELPLKKSEC